MMQQSDVDFPCAPGLRLQAHERVTALQFDMMTTHVKRIEQMVEMIERRLWLIVYGMLAVILAELLRSVIIYTT